MMSDIDRERRGLIKLMLKMPALRGKLQLLSATNSDVLGLCGAFDDATSTLDRLRKENMPVNPAMIAEYESLCEDIEKEIIAICVN